MATLSILGLYNFDNTIFDGLDLPIGIKKDNVVNMILTDCAELEVLYTSPSIIKTLITIWSETRLYTWIELYKTMQFEYNPIENYDRREEWQTTNNSVGESVGKTSGFDSNILVNANGANTSVNNNETRTGRTHGNIGVTTTQQMIAEQRRVVDFNIVQYIVNDFKRQFCLLVY